eukprot:TRINITY_DN13458_c0_g3_i1.p1 TRINITY_DN13458_c0_g3~~TRINITY_DN13458_c0_g3_i1.p1  ORF type:complete len:627 (-),score=87.35 TRINITY_DN13458_c0_g3_i1:1009-2889(-)
MSSIDGLAREMEWWHLEDLMAAVRDGQLAAVQERILRNDAIDLNARHMGSSIDGPTPLLLAAQHGHIDLVLFLVSQGADPNARTMSGLSLLHCAVASQSLELVRRVIDDGLQVDVNARDLHLFTPLMLAVASGDCPDLVDLLCSRGADVTLTDKTRHTVLHIACRENRTASVERLLAHGVPVDTRDLFRRTPLSLTSDPDIILKFLRKGAAVSDHGQLSQMLNEAISRGHVAVVKELLGRGAPANSRSLDGRTPLIRNVDAQHKPRVSIAIASALLKAGADLGLQVQGLHLDRQGVDAFLYACYLGQVDLAAYFVSMGAAKDSITVAYGYDAAHCAVMGQSVDMLEYLVYDLQVDLGRRASPYAHSPGGTPLHLLLSVMAPGPHRERDAQAAAPAAPAQQQQQQQQVEGVGGEEGGDGVAAAQGEGPDPTLAMIAPPRERDEQPMNYLQWYSAHTVHLCEDLVLVLLEAGANARSHNHQGVSALEVALRAQLGTIAILLCEYGARIQLCSEGIGWSLSLQEQVDAAPEQLRRRLYAVPQVPSLTTLAVRQLRAQVRDEGLEIQEVPQEVSDLIHLPHPYLVTNRASLSNPDQARWMYTCHMCRTRQSARHPWCIYCLEIRPATEAQ